jgi:hypothetical protein
MTNATPLQADHDRRDAKRRTVGFVVLFVGGKILPRVISELVNRFGFVSSWSILLLLAADAPWYVREVGTPFQRPRNKTSLSLPPAARNTVGAAMRTECGLNQSGLKPNAMAQSLIVR